MQASEIISDVRGTLVEPIAGFWSDPELLQWINRAERDFFNKTRLNEDKDDSVTLTGVNKYPVPSNLLSIRAVMYNDITDPTQVDNWIRLKPTNLEKTLQENPNFLANVTSTQGPPRAYFIWGREIYLIPSPLNQSNLKLFFKSKPIKLLTASQELNTDDSLTEGITAFILWKAWEKEQENDKADVQRQIYEMYVKEGRRWQKKQSGDQRYRLDISSPTPFEGPFDNRFNPLA